MSLEFELEFIRETSITSYYLWLQGYLFAYETLLGLNPQIPYKTFSIYENGKSKTYTQKGNLVLMKNSLNEKSEDFCGELIHSYINLFKKFQSNPERILNKSFAEELFGKFILVFLLGDIIENKFKTLALGARKETENLFPLTYCFFEKRGINPNLTYDEIILNKEVTKADLAKRENSILDVENILIVSSNKGFEDYLSENKLIISTEKISSSIKGNPASTGIVRGPVSLVLSKNDLSKVKEGDILVTTMTSPDFVVVMEKVKGIITDEGGITSHAAIVSRELGIPCIVGTKVGTKSFKDGDLIELNADKGIVENI